MLLFSTILNINESMTKDDFIKLVLEWNQKSPHEKNVIKNIEWRGEHNIRFGDENLWLDIEEYRNKNTIAVRYEKKELDGVIWDTDYIMNFDSMKMAIRLDRSYLEEALTVDAEFSAPHFITLLIERGYVRKDGELPVLRTPIIIDNDKLDILADIINGKTRYKLPVVFISKTFYDEDPVNVKALAKNLKGVAHVLVQESNCSNSRLKNLCDGKNEYYGAIGIYYANQAMGHRRYLYRNTEGMDLFLLQKVVRSVIHYSNAQMVDALYTWQGVNNALLRDKLSSKKEESAKAEEGRRKTLYELLELKANFSKAQEDIQQKAMRDAKAEADKLLNEFDEETDHLKKQIGELMHSIDVLTYENQGLRAKLNNVERVPVLYFGDEDEFFQDEIKEMILDTIEEKIKNLKSGTRRYDVLGDILNNNDYHHIHEERGKKIKNTLKDYKTLSNVIRQELQDMGIEITSDNRHYRLTYYGDGRYKTTLSKTGSDWREGKNSATNIINNMM